jgi:hypothetical protein
MGLLDDAIREHLELKRLNGADPGAVAREEHDALGPVLRESEAHEDGQEGKEASQSDAERTASEAEQPQAHQSLSTSQETVEINMDAELARGGHREQVPEPSPAAPVAHLQTKSEESFEWEVPQDEVPAESAISAEADDEVGNPVDDVLEETPDFLRDTPEQERLWFEQRPPRDFDFNE